MPDADHQHYELVVYDFVDNSVDTDAQAPQARELTFESAAGTGLPGESIDRVNDRFAIVTGEAA